MNLVNSATKSKPPNLANTPLRIKTYTGPNDGEWAVIVRHANTGAVIVSLFGRVPTSHFSRQQAEVYALGQAKYFLQDRHPNARIISVTHRALHYRREAERRRAA